MQLEKSSAVCSPRLRAVIDRRVSRSAGFVPEARFLSVVELGELSRKESRLEVEFPVALGQVGWFLAELSRSAVGSEEWSQAVAGLVGFRRSAVEWVVIHLRAAGLKQAEERPRA